MIKDSGNRTEFPTGAVRDIQEGKGRCDLLPLDVVHDLFAANGAADNVWFYLGMFTMTGDVDHLFRALLRFKDFAFHKSISTMVLEVAIHFEEGAKKYGERNWEKGIPVQRYIDSAVRHYLKWLRGDEDERHDRAFCWNILCAVWTCNHMPELNEYRKEDHT